MLNYPFRLISFNRAEWRSRAYIERLQLLRVKRIIGYAYKNSTYYKRSFDRVGVSDIKIRSLADIRELPFLTKDDLQEYGLTELSSKRIRVNNCMDKFSSGSSGRPIHLKFTPEDVFIQSLLFLRVLSSSGIKVFSRILDISDITPGMPQEKKVFQRLGIFDIEKIPVSLRPREIIENILSYRPNAIYAWPSTLRIIAEELGSPDKKFYGKILLFTRGEVLDKGTRSFIERAFKTRVSDIYGSTESSFIAWECPRHEGYHINIDSLVVEVLRPDGTPCEPDEEGEIVVTNLFSYAMPIIRYRLGDIGILSKDRCSCGRGLPLLKKIVGRSDDYLVKSNGQKVSPLIFSLEKIPGIKQYRMIQKERGSFELLFIRGKHYNTQTVDQIRENIAFNLRDPGLKLDIREVKELHTEKSGKFKRIFSIETDKDG